MIWVALRTLLLTSLVWALVNTQAYPEPDGDLWAFAGLPTGAEAGDSAPSVPLSAPDLLPPPSPPADDGRSTVVLLAAMALGLWLVALGRSGYRTELPDTVAASDMAAANAALRAGRRLLDDPSGDPTAHAAAVRAQLAAVRDGHPLLPVDVLAALADCERAVLAHTRACVLARIDILFQPTSDAPLEELEAEAVTVSAVEAVEEEAERLARTWLDAEAGDAVRAATEHRRLRRRRQAQCGTPLPALLPAADAEPHATEPHAGALALPALPLSSPPRASRGGGGSDSEAAAPATPLAELAARLQAHAGPGALSPEAALLKAADVLVAQQQLAEQQRLQVALHRARLEHERALHAEQRADQWARDDRQEGAAAQRHAELLRACELKYEADAASARSALLERRRAAAAALRDALEADAARCHASDAAAARAAVTMQLALLAGCVLVELACVCLCACVGA
jgi:hypothetical protein